MNMIMRMLYWVPHTHLSIGSVYLSILCSPCLIFSAFSDCFIAFETWYQVSIWSIELHLKLYSAFLHRFMYKNLSCRNYNLFCKQAFLS